LLIDCEKKSIINMRSSNVQAVMDGDIDMFIQAKLRGEKAGKGEDTEV